jgi:hypothetical protein
MRAARRSRFWGPARAKLPSFRSANEQAHLPGPLERLFAARNKNAAQVKLS